jgi:hypothetical protein
MRAHDIAHADKPRSAQCPPYDATTLQHDYFEGWQGLDKHFKN